MHGLISELVDSDNLETLEQHTNDLVKKINSNSEPIVSLGKQFYYKQIEKESIAEAYELGCDIMIDNLKYKDCQIGLKAFVDKKKPIWSNKGEKIAD
jgi:hypothetical protein